MRNHHLPVTYNRFQEENIFDVNCPLCTTNEVGDESHYLFSCTFFTKERLSYLPKNFLQTYRINDPLVPCQIFEYSHDTIIGISIFVRIVMKYFKQYKKHQLVKKKIKLFE